MNPDLQRLINMMQANYSLRNIPATVAGSGNEVTIDFHVPAIVDSYRTCQRIINNPGSYSVSDVNEARRAIEKLKQDISQGKPQTQQDRQMFINARVNKLTFLIGSSHLVSVPIN